MGLLGGIVKLWKKKNKLRSKISIVSREIDKGLGWDKIWDLPGGQLQVKPTPTFDFSEDSSNILRLGNAQWNAGGYRAVAPQASANGKTYPSTVLSDTLSLSNANQGMLGAAPIANPVHDVTIPTQPGLSTIRNAMYRPYSSR
jgi:hypothetical protein